MIILLILILILTFYYCFMRDMDDDSFDDVF